jgi:hypothetical protein
MLFNARYLYLLLILFGIESNTFSQKKQLNYSVESGAIGSTGKSTAFWAVSNRYGTISNNPNSAYLRTGLFVGYDSTRYKKLDYSLGGDIINRYDGDYDLIFQQYYLKFRYRFLNLEGGRIQEIFGNQDPTLSTGCVLFSTNARPIPKITAGIPNYTAIPFSKGYLEIKGGLSQGWFGKDYYVKNTLLHQKYFFVRIGEPLPISIHYGLFHAAQWGGDSPEYGKMSTTLKDYFIIFFAKQLDTTGMPKNQENEYKNRIGNHLGSRFYGMDIKGRSFLLSLYYQTIIEDIGGANGHNIRDGLWGISLKLKRYKPIQKIVLEFLNTTDQSMWWPVKRKIFEPDNYFYNYYYKNGWTYKNNTIGTPLITSPAILNKIDPSNPTISTWNNRVVAAHIGLSGEILATKYKILSTYTLNKGLWSIPLKPYRESLSSLIELSRHCNFLNGVDITTSVAFDLGKMYTNNTTLMISLRKSGFLF